MSGPSTLNPVMVGQPIERVEDLRFVRGRGQYVDDLHREGLLHAAIFRSPVGHAQIKSINTEAARRLPGVHLVFTAQDIQSVCGKVPTTPLRLAPMPELVPFEQPMIAHGRVRYVGEPIAVVIADSAAIAEDAVELIEADFEFFEAAMTRQQAEDAAYLLFEGEKSNIPMRYTASKGDAKAVSAPYVRRETFRVQRHSAVTMETRGILAEWDPAKKLMQVSGAAKVPYNTRRVLAKSLGLDEASIEVYESDVGGGFGVRGEFYPEDFLVPFAAWRLGRPVKWIEDRRENLLASNHSREIECEIEIRCTKEGKVLALLSDAWVDMGAYVRTSAAVPPRNVAQFLSGPYDIEHIHAQSAMFLTNKTPIGTYRGPGRFEADFFRERIFSMAAKDLGIDPVAFRRMNLVKPEQMPYPLATLRPVEKSEALDSGDYQVTLDRCLKEIGWNEKVKQQGKLVNGVYHGLAVGCFVEGGAAGPAENARFELNPDGTISLFVGSTSIGQGLETVCLQIASDALGIPMDQMKIFHGSTPYLKQGYGSYHSRSTVMGGSAILDAAENFKNKLKGQAAERLGCPADKVSLGAGLTASFGGSSLALSDLGLSSLYAEGTFENHHHTYAFGAAAAHVTVDPGTGQVTLLEYVTIEDIGRIINPLTSTGQAIGAVVQGLGGTFLEAFQYDSDGQFLSGSLADYLLPTATDFPNIKAIVLENAPAPHNPLGAKGGGEGGIVPVGGVVANAVAEALTSLGIEPHDLPLTPQRIWGLIQEKKKRAA